MKTQVSLLALSMASAMLSLNAQAEASDLEHIEVSSDFRGTDVQQLAASVSVIGSDLIEQRDAQHLDELLNVAANLNFNSGASRGRFVQIRGIGERSQYSEPTNSSVGFFVDGMNFSGTLGIASLFDVAQVEVLRGPQATAFGAGAMAGAIKIKTTEADGETSGRVALTLAQKDTWSLGAAYGSAITDKLFYRVALQQYKSDGFIENTYLDRDDTDNLDEFSGRLKLRYLASDSLSIDLNYQYFDMDNGYDAFSLENDRHTRSDQPGFDRQKTHALSLQATQQLSFATLNAQLSYSTSDLDYGYDEDWTYVGFHPWEYSSVDYYFRTRDITSVDLRLTSNDSSKLFADTTDWVVGVYAQDTDESVLRQYTYNDADFSSTYTPKNVALYAQLDNHFAPQWLLTFGLRADNFQIDYDDVNGFVESSDDTMLGGKLALSYQLPSATLYTSISRGYKVGGFNANDEVSDAQRIYDPEYSWNYEFGVKGYSENGYARAAVFYMQRDDVQVNDYDLITREDLSTEFVDIIDNAGEGTNWGLELEAGWQVNPSWEISGAFGYLRAEYKDYTQADGTYVDSREQAQAPRYTYHLSSDWLLTDCLKWNLEVEGKDDYYFSDSHDERNPAYALVHTKLSYLHDDWEVSFWVKNLMDKTYYTRGFGGFNNDPREYYEGEKAYYQLGDGRQAGISASYQF